MLKYFDLLSEDDIEHFAHHGNSRVPMNILLWLRREAKWQERKKQQESQH